MKRRATHAGSWYNDDGIILNQQLDNWIRQVGGNPNPGSAAKILIAPHAGYSYSGPCAAFSYTRVVPENIQRVVLIGPSHHAHLSKPGLSAFSTYCTPLGNITIDQEINAQLISTGIFDNLPSDIDEQEHSLELHLPFIRKVMGKNQFQLVPIMIGQPTVSEETEIAASLIPLFNDPGSLFILSSDFCHWGSRFQYTPFLQKRGTVIHECIQEMDQAGMTLIENQDLLGFRSYLTTTKNTICGRYPILIMLNLLSQIKNSKTDFRIEFVKYSQSCAVTHPSDSSVSYASAVGHYSP